VKAKGTISKMCYCREDSTGERLRARCPRLKRANGSWSSTHGVWTYQLELPRTGDGKRRTLRRVPPDDATSHDAVIAELNHARELMKLADGDPDLADEIATVLMGCKRGKPLPDKQRLARHLRSGVPNAASVTLGEYLSWWIINRQIDDHTRINYASHVRVHLVPHLGHVAVQVLNATHIEAMFGRMRQRNAEILAARDSDDPMVRGSIKGERLTMPATMTRIKATLRKALNDAVEKHRLIDFNPAIHAETPTYDRQSLDPTRDHPMAVQRLHSQPSHGLDPRAGRPVSRLRPGARPGPVPAVPAGHGRRTAPRRSRRSARRSGRLRRGDGVLHPSAHHPRLPAGL
jgi:hypothetical protein